MSTFIENMAKNFHLMKSTYDPHNWDFAIHNPFHEWCFFANTDVMGKISGLFKIIDLFKA